MKKRRLDRYVGATRKAQSKRKLAVENEAIHAKQKEL